MEEGVSTSRREERFVLLLEIFPSLHALKLGRKSGERREEDLSPCGRRWEPVLSHWCKHRLQITTRDRFSLGMSCYTSSPVSRVQEEMPTYTSQLAAICH